MGGDPAGGIFTFPVFIMYRFFRSIPKGIIESAELDGANKFQVFLHIGVPLGSSGIVSALVLSFLDAWNLIEQPLTFLKNKNFMAFITVFLPNISMDNAGLAFVASVITLIPSLLVLWQDRIIWNRALQLLLSKNNIWERNRTMKLKQLMDFEMDKDKKSSLQVKAIKVLAGFLILMFFC